MRTNKTNSITQLSLFPQEEVSEKRKVRTLRTHSTQASDSQSASDVLNARLQVIKSYLHSRDGLWRLLACFPQDMPVVEAMSLAPSVIFGLRKEVAL